MTPLLVIVGPTASGKSDLAIALAKYYGGEVISADSIQVYCGMDIGTGKVSTIEADGVPHHMLDVVDPRTDYNVAMYRSEAKKHINRVLAAGKTPILCGGTGLYINALLYPMQLLGRESNTASREKWQRMLEKLGPDGLYKVLQKTDEVAAAKIHPNNIRRVIRALEIAESGIKPVDALQDTAYAERTFVYSRTILLGLEWPREQLRERISRRVDAMMQQGLLEETRQLLEKGVNPDGTAMQGLGYRQLIPVLRGEASVEQAVSEIKLRTGQYAKRQMSWFRRESRIHWLQCEGKDFYELVSEAEAYINGF